MSFEFECALEVIEWRGPAPFYFGRIPEALGAEIASLMPAMSYGWGCVYADISALGQYFETALMPHEGTYVVPIKAALRSKLGVAPGDIFSATIALKRQKN